MSKEKLVLQIGEKMALTYWPDQASQSDLEFAENCKQAAASNPVSLQDFFIRLNALQKAKKPESPGRRRKI
ncbi:hypothetical protein [Pedobacter sp. KLB.chiD]|uniref:hypothetical protein n=1 Tax=Pedobacter sp. KLB.chiD TaxID=3387402 RepID=UPI00399B923D